MFTKPTKVKTRMVKISFKIAVTFFRKLFVVIINRFVIVNIVISILKLKW